MYIAVGGTTSKPKGKREGTAGKRETRLKIITIAIFQDSPHLPCLRSLVVSSGFMVIVSASIN